MSEMDAAKPITGMTVTPEQYDAMYASPSRWWEGGIRVVVHIAAEDVDVEGMTEADRGVIRLVRATDPSREDMVIALGREPLAGVTVTPITTRG